MLNSQKILHILITVFMSILYSCFIVQLLHPSSLIFLYLTLYYAIFLIYTLKTYAAFHYPPSEPNIHSDKVNISSVFKFKLTQERRIEVERQLRTDKNKKDSLIEQYIKLLKSPSFCDMCENVQPPRAEHCKFCNTCIMGKHFHSQIIGYCIGQSNQLIYLEYVLASAILSGYSALTLLITHAFSDNFDKLQSSTSVLFFLLAIAYLLLSIFFTIHFLQLFQLLQQNKTGCEQHNPFLPNHSIFSQKQTQQKLTFRTTFADLFSFKSLGEVSSWMAQTEQLAEQ